MLCCSSTWVPENLQGKQQRQEFSGLIAALKACSSSRDLERGRSVHLDAVEAGQESNIYVGSSLINMYAKCGSLVDAQRVFDRMVTQNVVSWTALLLGYVENKEEELAMNIFVKMQLRGCVPNARTYVAALKACSGLAAKEDGSQVDGKILKLIALEMGMAIHCQAEKHGFGGSNIFVGNTLVDFYANCGSMEDSFLAFQRMQFQTVVSWNALVTGYVKNGQELQALECFLSMNCCPDARTFAAAAKACAALAVKEERQEKSAKMISLERGMAVHAEAARCGCETDVYVANTLVAMYVKCGSMEDASRTFHRNPQRTVMSYNSLMVGYNGIEEAEIVLKLFESMQRDGCVPNAHTNVAALKASVLVVESEEKDVMTALETGMALHFLAAKLGFVSDLFVASSLVDMYARCGSMVDAARVFNGMPERDVVVWNALIQGYVENGEEDTALKLFAIMQAEGCKPNSRSFVAALQACSNETGWENGKFPKGSLTKSLEIGMAVHSRCRSCCGGEMNLFVESALIDMYGKCGSLTDSWRIFEAMKYRDAVAWNALMQACLENGEQKMVLEVFQSMQREGCCAAADGRSYATALKACSCLAAEETAEDVEGMLVKASYLEKGMAIHSHAAMSLRLGMDNVLREALVEMYARCGSLVDAERVFATIPQRSLVVWNSLIQGCAENGEEDQALSFLAKMDVQPDARTLTAALTACGRSVNLRAGKAIHGEICRRGFDDGVTKTSLVDFYGKCGGLIDAQVMFDTLILVDGVAWTALMAACSRGGDAQRVLDFFRTMREEGSVPDAIKASTINRALAMAIPGDGYPQNLHQAIRYSLITTGGKRMCPVMCIAACELMGADETICLPTACSLEMIHAMSLVHDDLPSMDDALVRRGNPTTHKLWGQDVAILAGDALLALAFEHLSDEQPKLVSDQSAVLRVIGEVSRACRSMASGQAVDLEIQGQRNVTLKEVEFVHMNKTAKLLEASVVCGSILGGGSCDDVEKLRRYAGFAGLMYQVVDDVLDVIKSSEELGKPAGSDEVAGKATYPKLLGLEKSVEFAQELRCKAKETLAGFQEERAIPLLELADFIADRLVVAS